MSDGTNSRHPTYGAEEMENKNEKQMANRTARIAGERNQENKKKIKCN